MRVVLLCAGYGTRLARSIEADDSGLFNHLKNVPKPLLPIGDKSLISHWIEVTKDTSSIREIVIVTNEIHMPRYQKLLEEYGDQKLIIVSDGSQSNETRSGAVACMDLGVKNRPLMDTIFIAGDTLFGQDFRLRDVLQSFESSKQRGLAGILISAPVLDANVSKHGILEVNHDGIVKTFLEKPAATETNSRLQSPCFYVIVKEYLVHISEFLETRKQLPLRDKDATGKFIEYFITKVDVGTYHVTERFDIGDLSSYIKCCEKFERIKK